MSRRARLAAAVGAVLLSSIAAGCVSIPSSSGVGEASEIGVTDKTAQITNLVQGPLPGASAQAIVLGFYGAMLAYPPRPDIVREFLTDDAASKWDPSARVTVYDQQLQASGDGPTVSVTAEAAGHLDRRGSWRSAQPGKPATPRVLRLEPIGGELRIANPPKGIFINTDFFLGYYQAFSLYFFDPSGSTLTPDPVYLPVGDTAATALVQDLLEGPTADLRNAVFSAAPADAQLQVSVSVSSSGLAEVPLSSDVMNLPQSDRQLFAAQLAWTLRQIDGVQRIAINVDGGSLPIENSGSPFDAYGFAGYDPAGLAGERRLFALDDEGLVALGPGGPSPVPGLIGDVHSGSSAAVQTSGQLAAIVSDDGTSVSVGPLAAGTAADDQSVSVWYDNAQSLMRPSWDARQVLWLIDQDPAGQRIVVATGPQHRYAVRAPWLTGQQILAFSVSRDGVRLAAIVRDRQGRVHLEVSTIDRGPGKPTAQQPVRLRTPTIVMNSAVQLTRLDDLAWVSPTSLAVLGAEGADDDLQAYEVAIDGSDIEAAGGNLQVRPISIAAGPNADAPIAIATGIDAKGKGGFVYVQGPDLAWTRIAAPSPLYAPVYPG